MFPRWLSRRRFVKEATAATAVITAAGFTPALTTAADSSVIFSYPYDPGSFDPTICSGQNCAYATEPLYEGLTQFDEKGNVQPCLATSWENPEPTTWIFHLRSGVKFHNGQPLTADDVKYSLDRVLDPKMPGSNRPYFEAIKQVDVVDPATVKLTLSAPFVPLLGALSLSSRGAAIINKAWAEDQTAKGITEFATTEMGTGPFKLSDYVSGDHFTYQRFDDYWDTKPQLQTISWKILQETAARVAALRAGTIDYAKIDANAAKQLESDKKVTVYKVQGFGMPISIHNLRRKPYSDLRVRQAIAMGVDRQAVIDKVYDGQASLTGPVMTGFADWFIPVDQLPYRLDRDKAKALLAEAGYPKGFETTILGLDTYPYNQVGVVYQAQLEAIGIKAKLQQTEFTAWLDKIHKFDFDTHVNGYGFDYDPSAIMGRSFECGSSGNFPGYCDPKFDQLEKQLEETADHTKRVRTALAMEKMLLEAAPDIWWCTGFDFYASSTKLKNFTPSSTGYMRNVLKTVGV